MAQYDVFARPRAAGYLLDIQSDFHDDLDTRVVVPLLLTHEAPKPLRYLNPLLQVNGTGVVMMTQLLAAVFRRELGNAVASLHGDRDKITRGLDHLLNDF